MSSDTFEKQITQAKIRKHDLLVRFLIYFKFYFEGYIHRHMDNEFIGAIKIKDGLFIGDEYAAQV